MLNASDLIRHVHQADFAEGILGFTWRAPRVDVYRLLPESATRDTADLGSRFFTHVSALIESESVHLHFQFADGLTGITVTPLTRIAPQEDLLRLLTELPVQYELDRYLGAPTRVHDANPQIMRLLEWEAPPLTVVLLATRRGEVNLTYRLSTRSDTPRPTLEGREVELEDLVPSSTRIQYLIDRADYDAAGKLTASRRLGLGWCPHCGCVIGTWHLPDCAFTAKDELCRNCQKSRAELPSQTCLPCAQRKYVRMQLELTDVTVLEREHQADNAIRLQRVLDQVDQNRPWFVKVLDAVDALRQKYSIGQLVLGLLVILAILRMTCGN